MPIDYMILLKTVPEEEAIQRSTVTVDSWNKQKSSDEIWLSLQI